MLRKLSKWPWISGKAAATSTRTGNFAETTATCANGSLPVLVPLCSLEAERWLGTARELQKVRFESMLKREANSLFTTVLDARPIPRSILMDPKENNRTTRKVIKDITLRT
jgi:hypothetical protein